MRILRVSVFVILAAALAFIGIAPRKIFAGRQARQVTDRHVSRHQAATQRAAQRAQVRVSAIKPAVIPGATGLVAVPIFTDDKQIPVTGGPSVTIPLFNASTTNTITISSVILDDTTTGSFTVDTDCTTLAPGASCNLFVTFISPIVCAGDAGPAEGLIDVASDDPVLDGAPLQVGVEGFGSDGNFQIKNLTDTSLTPDQLAAQLVGTGVHVSNVKYTGAAVSAGTFSTSTNIVGFNDGIVLSTGSVRSVVGPNCYDEIDGENETAGDPDLGAILGSDQTTNDAAVLEFDFIPDTSSLSFQYVFASDEYNEFVGEFNDVFAFFLNGNNIALLPGISPPTPVSINNVNLTTNPQFYINNDIDQLANPPVDTEMDGLTVVLTATAQVTAGQTNHIKLAIADAVDFAVDSNVFIKAGSFTSSQITLSPTSLDFGDQPQGTTSSPPKPITVTNIGNTSVTITSVVASANFGETDGCVGALPPNGTCTIQATFQSTATGSIAGTIMVNDNAAGSPQSVTLTGNGTASTVTLTSITVTPNPATVAVGGQIQFTATGHFSDGTTKDITTNSNWSSSNTNNATIDSETGLATGVAVTDGAVTITATGVGTEVSGTAQLTVSNVQIMLTIPPPPGGTFGPVNPGGMLPVGVVITANPGFTGTVTFGCTTNSPTITCLPRPSEITITSNGPLQVAIVVETFCKGLLAPLGVNPRGFGGGLALLLVAGMLAGSAWTFRRNPRWALSFAMFVLIALGGVACNSLPRGANGATPPGDYTLTISATVNGQTVTATPVQFHVN
ncbi:MAG: choice-of-anchor L domain-containing protein [Candidatus Acidiferrales bacterium]